MTDDVYYDRHLTVSQRLRDRRHDLGLTQKQVVQRLVALGVHTTNKTLSCHENGSGLDVARLPALARALDCTTTYLLGLTGDPSRWEPDGLRTLRAGPPREQAHQREHRPTWILGPGVPDTPPRQVSTALPRQG